MNHPIEYYKGKDVAVELLLEKINALQNMERTFADTCRLNALVELQIEIENVEARLPLPF